MSRSYLWDYDSRIAIQYVRIGECAMCGDCCRGGIHFSVIDETEEDYLGSGGRATSGEGQWVEISPYGQRIYFKMKEYDPWDEACEHLQDDGKCGAYSQRSTLCFGWPFLPSDLTPFPNCSYKFVKVGQWSFEEIPSHEAERDETLEVSSVEQKNLTPKE